MIRSDDKAIRPLTDGPDISTKLLRKGSNLRQDTATVEAVKALRDVDIRALLLKGPSLQFLYDKERPRTYIDSDLLVSNNDVESAEQVLVGLGFETAPLLPNDRPWVAREWVRDRDMVVLELHRTFEGIEAAPDEAWTALSRVTSSIELRGEAVETLSLPGKVLIVALHALEHRFHGDKPIEDLEQAIQTIGMKTWTEAGELAAEIKALPAFIGGLTRTSNSDPILRALNLEAPKSLETDIRRASTPPMSVGINWLMSRPSLFSKLSLIVRKTFPPPSYIRSWLPRAKRNRRWLVVAYAWRPLWLVGKAVPAFQAWRRVKRQPSDLGESKDVEKT